MASISRSRRALECRPGGKIVRPRRTIGPKTPYDRPQPRFTNRPQENPNWLSKLIVSPTRMVVSGAGKLISAVFSSADSSSSSSSSSSGFNSVSVDVMEDDYDDISSQFADRLQKRDGTSRMIERFGKDVQPLVEKNDNKRVIEQLLKQETFTRDECNKFIRIIKSRVVDHHANVDKENETVMETLYRTVGDADKHELCSTAVLEARKWLTEKKVGSASKSDLDHVEDQMGSPVDMAKSYMRERPLWASPSFNQREVKSPSPVLAQLTQTETPYSIGKAVSLFQQKRDTPTSGSWNIQEEIQRVRAKATEEMLRNLPSKRIDWSVSAFEKNISASSLISENVEAGIEDKMQSTKENVDASLCITTKRTTSHELQVLESTQDGLQNEVSPDRVNIISKRSQDMEDTQLINGKGGSKDIVEDIVNIEHRLELSEDVTTMSLRDADADIHAHKDTNAADQQLSAMDIGNIEGSQERNCSISKEVSGSRINCMTNGFPSSQYSLSAEVFNEQNDLQHHDEHNLVNSSDCNMATGEYVDETCKFLTETSIEIPNKNDTMDENDSIIASGFQNGLGEDDESSRDLTRPTSKRSPAAKNCDTEKLQVKRVTRYNRTTGRGRGK